MDLPPTPLTRGILVTSKREHKGYNPIAKLTETRCDPSSAVQRREEVATTVPFIIAAIFMAVVIYWLIRSQQKAAHQLDGLHITPEEPGERKKD